MSRESIGDCSDDYYGFTPNEQRQKVTQYKIIVHGPQSRFEPKPKHTLTYKAFATASGYDAESATSLAAEYLYDYGWDFDIQDFEEMCANAAKQFLGKAFSDELVYATVEVR